LLRLPVTGYRLWLGNQYRFFLSDKYNLSYLSGGSIFGKIKFQKTEENGQKQPFSFARTGVGYEYEFCQKFFCQKGKLPTPPKSFSILDRKVICLPIENTCLYQSEFTC